MPNRVRVRVCVRVRVRVRAWACEAGGDRCVHACGYVRVRAPIAVMEAFRGLETRGSTFLH